MTVYEDFVNILSALDRPKVLELGTGRWNQEISTHHGSLIPKNGIHIKSDIFSGTDVDIVSDAHDLKEISSDEFDVVMAFSVWEHLRKPWIAAQAVHRILKPGGLLFVQTHFNFPVHGYPSDYSRWTDEGLKAIFDHPEWNDQRADMTFPCTIIPPSNVANWDNSAPTFLNVNILVSKQ